MMTNYRTTTSYYDNFMLSVNEDDATKEEEYPTNLLIAENLLLSKVEGEGFLSSTKTASRKSPIIVLNYLGQFIFPPATTCAWALHHGGRSKKWTFASGIEEEDHIYKLLAYRHISHTW